MKTTQRLCPVLMALVLAACGAPKQTDHGQAEHELRPVDETVFADQVGAIDKARAVEETMHQHAKQVDEAVQEHEREP